jgi:RNA polymerase sigma-70 factor (ECF subfamily)
MPDPAAAVEAVFRAEHGRILAGLIRVFGDFDLAEDALQDAYAAALAHWGREPTPRNPAAWITTAARRKALDRLRRARRTGEPLPPDLPAPAWEPTEAEPEAEIFPDDRLRLVFTCCHPALGLEAQVALTLRTLGGLTTAEIAGAFLVSEATMAQRLVRARRKIRLARIPYRIPPVEVLPERLSGVLAVVYLVFNEGYAASAGPAPVRADLCEAALRLARALADLLPREPEALGLLALLLLHHSRRAARVDPAGRPVLLDEQDRALWDAEAIREGTALLRGALRMGRAGPYQIQAAIAAVHAEAATPAAVDWPQIAALYAELLRRSPTPVARLNHAVAVGMAAGPAAGLALMEAPEVAEPLADYRWWHSARGELLSRLGRPEAAESFRRALRLTENAAERAFLEGRLGELEGRPE